MLSADVARLSKAYVRVRGLFLSSLSAARLDQYLEKDGFRDPHPTFTTAPTAAPSAAVTTATFAAMRKKARIWHGLELVRKTQRLSPCAGVGLGGVSNC